MKEKSKDLPFHKVDNDHNHNFVIRHDKNMMMMIRMLCEDDVFIRNNYNDDFNDDIDHNDDDNYDDKNDNNNNNHINNCNDINDNTN